MNNLEIKNQISSFEKEVDSLKGKLSLLNQQLEESLTKQKDLQHLQLVNNKAVEILHLVKKVTEERITENFERVGTSALQVIHQSNDYKFKLEFGRRGQLPELRFNVITPEMSEFHNILNVSAGGSRDVLALALRFIVLELSKNPGFLFLDEPEKRLDNPETLKQMIKFIIDFQKKTGRQIIAITHKQEFVDAVPNPIIFGDKMKKRPREELIRAVETSTAIECVKVKLLENDSKEEKPKKGRGRPKKSKEEKGD